MYQQGGCLLTKAIESVDWRQYGLEQPGAKGVPKGPAAILVHLVVLVLAIFVLVNYGTDDRFQEKATALHEDSMRKIIVGSNWKMR